MLEVKCTFSFIPRDVTGHLEQKIKVRLPILGISVGSGDDPSLGYQPAGNSHEPGGILLSFFLSLHTWL